MKRISTRSASIRTKVSTPKVRLLGSRSTRAPKPKQNRSYKKDPLKGATNFGSTSFDDTGLTGRD